MTFSRDESELYRVYVSFFFLSTCTAFELFNSGQQDTVLLRFFSQLRQ